MKYKNIREEELKNKVGADWFKQFDTTEIIGNIDFTVFPKQDNLFGRTPLLWAEAKTGNFDIPTMFVQLIPRCPKSPDFVPTIICRYNLACKKSANLVCLFNNFWNQSFQIIRCFCY